MNVCCNNKLWFLNHLGQTEGLIAELDGQRKAHAALR